VVDTDNPVPYSVVVFRDPDNIQLELIYMPRNASTSAANSA